VLITDGDQRSALAAVRSLGRAGMAAFAADESEINLASRSRYCRGGVSVPSPFMNERGFVEAVAEAVLRLGIDLVIPMTDISSAVLSEHREGMGTSARVAVADRAAFWRASDKNALLAMAATIGVPTPVVRAIEQIAECRALEDLPLPCVIKPSRSLVRASGGWQRTAVLRAWTLDEVRRAFREVPWLQHPSTIQRFVEGEGIGVFALCDHGCPRLMFQHRRLREKPPMGGVSVLREAVPLDPDVSDYAARLLHALRWHGVAMVEFKRERSSGTAYLMELNARFWGSLQLAVDAGVDFPVEAVRLWMGKPVSPQGAYRTGVRSRWLLGDLDYLIMRLSGTQPVPADAPSLWALAIDFFNVFRRDTRCEVESWRDPGPFLHEWRAYLHNLFRAHTQSNA
jgi:predicted ATP-grasp superfamily ATP-dependent carboligase